MKSILVNKINLEAKSFKNIKNSFLDIAWNNVNEINWQEQYPYCPEVKFQIAYDEENIYLHYHVEEEFVKATYIRANENVWEDSCVEFFISFDNKKTYYNLEFNVLGTGLIGYGPAVKSERKRLSAEIIDSVNVFTEIYKIDGKKTWEIYLAIPLNVFGESSLKDKKLHANFYKCGDNLPNPHFISWNKIESAKPNFHLPEFFGEIHFK